MKKKTFGFGCFTVFVAFNLVLGARAAARASDLQAPELANATFRQIKDASAQAGAVPTPVATVQAVNPDLIVGPGAQSEYTIGKDDLQALIATAKKVYSRDSSDPHAVRGNQTLDVQTVQLANGQTEIRSVVLTIKGWTTDDSICSSTLFPNGPCVWHDSVSLDVDFTVNLEDGGVAVNGSMANTTPDYSMGNPKMRSELRAALRTWSND